MTNPEGITAAALAMFEDDRVDLIARLHESLEPPPASEDDLTDEEWDAELARRIDDVRSGREKGIPAAEAHRLIFGDHDDAG